MGIQCGGFCSDCQANNSSPIEAMKITFCSQIKTTGSAITKAKSRNSDRSPPSIKQSHIAKRLESSSGFKDGKENGTNVVEGKRQRKPAAPPALTPETVEIMAKPKLTNLAGNSKTEEEIRDESEERPDDIVNNAAVFKNSVKSNGIKKSPPHNHSAPPTIESKPAIPAGGVSRKRKLS